MTIFIRFHRFLERLKKLDFIGFLFLRLYLFYIFWNKGTNNLDNFTDFSEGFNILGSVFSEVIAWLVISFEISCAVSLLVGLFLRWSAMILTVINMITIFIILWQNSWKLEIDNIEMYVIYAVMLIALLFSGAGKYYSLDYWVSRK